ncbi:MAG: sugar ABC transporter substrate-binding protein, partial [Clostridia bacterium]
CGSTQKEEKEDGLEMRKCTQTGKTIRTLLIALLLCSLLLCSGGCAQQTKLTHLVGISLPSTSDSSRWVRDGKVLQDAVEALGCPTELCYASNSVQRQQQQLNQLLDDGARLLIIAAVDATALNEVLERAEANDVPVIAYEQLLMGNQTVDYYIGADNFMAGRLQAQYIINALEQNCGRPMLVEMFVGPATDVDARSIYAGMREIFMPYIASGELQMKSGETSFEQVCITGDSRESAQERMSRLIADVYDGGRPDAVVVPCDKAAMGVLDALQSAGVTELPLIAGQQGTKESVQAGHQSVALLTNARELAQSASEIVWELLCGDHLMVEATVNNGAADIPALLLTPQLVDRSDCCQMIANSGAVPAELP